MDIGIDLGTTFSVLAVPGRRNLVEGYPDPIHLEEADVTVIPSPCGLETFPSVAIENPDQPGEWLFGTDAIQKAAEGHAPIMFSKRKIGTREVFPAVSGPVTAKQVATYFLRYLKRSAEHALGVNVRRAVVTHPAYFDRPAVEETREAARDAGFDMSMSDQMLMEPVAAALAYTHSDERDPLRVLTYDLGGGTFDVTYLERCEGVISMRAFDGDHLLGGYNFDREIVQWVYERLARLGRQVALDEDKPEHRALLARVLQLAENVKIALANAKSDSTKVDIRWRNALVDVNGKQISVDEKMTRDEFVALIRPLLARTVAACARTLEKAGVTPDELDEVLLVGGSSRGPWIRDVIHNVCPHIEPKLFSPDLCVGTGAAIYARLCLPTTVESAEYRLVLDTPGRTSATVINLVGRICSTESGQSLPPAMQLHWQTPGGAAQVARVAVDGHFLVPDIQLAQESDNRVHLDFQLADGHSILQHELNVVHAADTDMAVGISTVLPRMLSVETLSGLVPLAAEGLALPAHCEPPPFEIRSNSPLISLNVFQEYEPIGKIRLANLPPEGCRGALVHLSLDLTEKCELRGSAAIVTPDGKLMLKRDIEVDIAISAVPSLADLQQQYRESKTKFVAQSQVEHLELELKEPGGVLIARIDHLFSQQPIERQEIEAGLRQLKYLLDPPDDDMMPTRREFRGRIAQLRASIDRGQQATDPMSGDVTEIDDGSPKLSDLPKKLEPKRAANYLCYLDRLETEGLTAHKRRDRRSWSSVQDGLDQITADVVGFPELDSLPPFLNKILALRQIQGDLERIATRKAELQNSGAMEEWRQEIANIEHGLNQVARRIVEIDDDVSPDLALAKIREVFQQHLGPLSEQISRLGVHVAAR